MPTIRDLLRNKLGRAKLPPPVVDPAFGDPDAVALRTALTAGDWPAARAVLSADRDANDYCFLVDQTALVGGVEEWLPEVIRADPDDTLAQLVYSARAVDWAWEARTGVWGRDVTPDRRRLFLQRLAIAEDGLQDVVRRTPSDTAAWTRLITVALGLSMPIEEKRRRFEQAVAPDPANFAAHRAMLRCLCLKWGGSHHAMHEFARNALNQHPPGNRLGGLVAQAHLEQWMVQSAEGLQRYFASAYVLDELTMAANLSVRHPAYVRATGWPVEHNHFAMALMFAGADDLAWEMFHAIGDHVTEMPWALLDEDPAAAFTRFRARAYR